MRRSSIVLALLAALPSALASPIMPSSVHDNTMAKQPQGKRSVDCRNTETGVDPSCWATLNMTNWVQRWYATHTCLTNEGFSNCFLRVNGFPATDCSVINEQSCGSDITNHIDTHTPEIFYVLYNIYAINNFFNSYWLATQFAASQAALKIDAIIQLLDPIQTHGMLFQDILTALLAGLAFIPGPVDIILGEGMQVLTHVVMASAMTGLVVAPGVVKALMPTQTENTQSVQIGQLKSQLGNLQDGISARLAPALQIAESDLTSFIQLASTGAFSAHPPWALDNQTKGMDQAFTTFLVSTSIMTNNWQGAVSIDTNPQALATNGTALQYDIDCDGYDANNICNAWWYDGVNNNAFTLYSLSSIKDNPYARMHTIINNGWSTGAQLFAGAYSCNQAGHFGQGIMFSPMDGQLNFDCLSQLKICTFDKQCTNAECEFSNCAVEPQWGFNNVLADYTSWFNVPAGYLGPLLTQFQQTIHNSGKN